VRHRGGWLDLGFVFCEALDLDRVLRGARSRSRACALLPVRRACLYSGGGAVYGAVAFISGIEI
jgi:hypothetical protein